MNHLGHRETQPAEEADPAQTLYHGHHTEDKDDCLPVDTSRLQRFMTGQPEFGQTKLANIQHLDDCVRTSQDTEEDYDDDKGSTDASGNNTMHPAVYDSGEHNREDGYGNDLRKRHFLTSFLTLYEV